MSRRSSSSPLPRFTRLALGLAAGLAGFASAGPAAATDFTVDVRDDFFSPAELTIQVGDRVTWRNLGNMAHNVNAVSGPTQFRCANGCTGQGGNGTPSDNSWQFTITFDEAGTIQYQCDLHGSVQGNFGMRGSIVVESSGGGGSDEAGQVRLTQSNFAVAEGNNVTIGVERLGGDDGAVSVDFATANGSAQSGSDYQAIDGTISFADNEDGIKTFAVTTLEDTADEPNETFTVSLSAPTGGATLGAPANATVTIQDDDDPGGGGAGTLRLADDPSPFAESAGNAGIQVQRVNGSTGPVSVSFATGDGSAVAGLDYTTAEGTLSWPGGDTEPRSIQVPILDDGEPEGAETLHVMLSDPTGGATLGRSAATLTIASNDQDFPPCEPDAQTLCLGEGGRFQVKVSFRTPQGDEGEGVAETIGKRDSGLFYFFEPDNIEMLVKVLPACSVNQFYWVYFAATTDVEFVLTVTDTDADVQKQYTNQQGNPANAVTDSSAFQTCP
jgi:plastocyanin